MRLAALIALGLWASAPVAMAQDSQVDPQVEPTQLEDIVVEGRRLDDVVRDFVGEVAAPAGVSGPARWNGQVCIGVVNLRTEAAQFIADRASDVARQLGVSAGEPGCKPNVLIIAAADGQAIADGLVEARRNVFHPGGSGMSRTLRDLEAFRTSQAPVRWWHVSAPVDSETGQLATRLPGYDAPQTNVSRASRLRSDIRDDLLRAIIIVDFAKLGDVSLPQLADYCTLLALAQIDPDADVAAFDTILNVFADPTQVAGLTDWDMEYLTALYTAEQDRVGSSARSAEIVERMMSQARREPDGATED